MPNNTTSLIATLPPSLRKLVNHLRSMMSPEQIFAVRHHGSDYTALLLVIPDNEPGRCINPAETVERMHGFHPQVHISLHKVSVMRHYLEKGHPYYSRACIPAHLIYSSGAAAPAGNHCKSAGRGRCLCQTGIFYPRARGRRFSANCRVYPFL